MSGPSTRVESWQGQGCCVSSPLDGVGFADDPCGDDCCAPVIAAPVAAREQR